MNPDKFRKLFLLFTLLVIFIFTSCSKNDSPVEPEITPYRGQLTGSGNNGNFPVLFLQTTISSMAGSNTINVKLIYDVNAYKISYRTVDSKGNIITVSGSIFIPVSKNNLSLISIQHGTQTKRTSVGSTSSLNAPEGLIAASLGYYAVVPDYIGLGESTLLHPYHLAKPSADAVVDIIRAGREFALSKGITLNGQVFLAGYSEGGYVTMAAQKEIEKSFSSEFNLTAVAPMAGAYDLNLTAKKIIEGKIYNQPAYLAFFSVAYNNYYGWNKLGEFFNPPYAEMLPGLFDGTKSTGEINQALTNDVAKLFKQSFIDAYLNGTETTLTQAFIENSLLDWTPKAPMRLYHGDADEYVPYENSTKARDLFRSRGTNVELITITGGTHTSTALPAITLAIEWFGSLKLSKSLASK